MHILLHHNLEAIGKLCLKLWRIPSLYAPKFLLQHLWFTLYMTKAAGAHLARSPVSVPHLFLCRRQHFVAAGKPEEVAEQLMKQSAPSRMSHKIKKTVV